MTTTTTRRVLIGISGIELTEDAATLTELAIAADDYGPGLTTRAGQLLGIDLDAIADAARTVGYADEFRAHHVALNEMSNAHHAAEDRWRHTVAALETVCAEVTA